MILCPLEDQEGRISEKSSISYVYIVILTILHTFITEVVVDSDEDKNSESMFLCPFPLGNNKGSKKFIHIWYLYFEIQYLVKFLHGCRDIFWDTFLPRLKNIVKLDILSRR